VHPAFGSNFITSGREAKFNFSLSCKRIEKSRLVAQIGGMNGRGGKVGERGEREERGEMGEYEGEEC